MKKLFFIIVIMFIFGCSIPTETKTETIIKEGTTWLKVSDEKVQIFPAKTSVAKNITFGSKLFATSPVTVSTEKQLSDRALGIVYLENCYSSSKSCLCGTICYMDVGTIVGTKQKMLVNVLFEVTQYSDNANPITVYVRAKGAKVAWTVLSPTLSTPDDALVLTDIDGILEYYIDGGAYYDNIDPEYAEPGVHRYGYQTIAGYADGYSVFLSIK